MRTTLNMPDDLVAIAKRRAIDESTTLTELLVEGLKARLSRPTHLRGRPVTLAAGGLLPNQQWDFHKSADEWYR